MISLFYLWVGSIVVTLVIANDKKLDMVAMFFVAFFLGPVGIIIALLSSNRAKGSQQAQYQFHTLDDAKQQLSIVKHSLSVLNNRVDHLERLISHLSGEPVKSPKGKAAAQEVKSTASVSKPKQAIAPKKEGFELQFGQYWLNRIGIVLFVLGIGLFISYTFQYLNAFAKILIGYALTAGLFYGGHFLEKKEKYRKISWGITGGAWGLLYVTTFAMHYFDATRIIASQTIEMWLLALVSASAIYYNLKYKSWVVTIITYLLAFITVGLGDINYSSVIFWTFLTASIAYLSYRLKWHDFLIVGIFGCYSTFFIWFRVQMMNVPMYSAQYSIPMYQFLINFSILSISCLIFACIFLLLNTKNEKQMQYLATGHLVNNGFYALLGLNEIYHVGSNLYLSWNPKYWFLIVLAAINFLIAYLNKLSDKSKLIVVNCCVAFGLIGMAVMIEFPRLSVSYIWLLQTVLLFTVGVYYKEYFYRIFALVMSFIIMFRVFIIDFESRYFDTFLGMSIPHDVLVFCVTATVFLIMGAVPHVKRFKSYLDKNEAPLYSAYPVMGAGLLVVIIAEEVGAKSLTLSWGLLGAALIGIGFLLHSKAYRVCALCVISLAFFRLIFFDIAGLTTIAKIVAFISLGIVMVGISMVYSMLKAKNE